MMISAWRSNISTTLLLGLFLFTHLGWAEPWMGSRFAENCAACHAPGRVNVEAQQRRCSFSCKACHTSPSGGGLRNAYGKWNQQRWLNSMPAPGYALQKARPMPAKDQFYSERRIATLDASKQGRAAQRGFKLRTTRDLLREKEYDQQASLAPEIQTLRDLIQLRIPDGDPYRVQQQQKINYGTDTRLSYLMNTNTAKVKRSGYLLLTDLEASVAPINNITLVGGGRFLTGPGRLAWDGGTKKTDAQFRSLYALADALPYNSFVQAGIYRPLFGLTSVDQASLIDTAMGIDQRANYTTVSVGTAPGAPFLNLHYLQPISDTDYAQDRGFVFNIGARLPIHGANLMLSYWSTNATDPSTSVHTKKQMMAFTGGATFGIYTGTLDFTRMSQDVGASRKDTGAAMTFDNRVRVWRENYIKIVYENLNTAPDLRDGKATSIEFGIASFPISSVQLDLSHRTIASSNTTTSGTQVSTTTNFNDSTTMAQVHFFY